MKPLQFKVCGMRNPGNITELLELPLEYMGMIFYDKSERFVDMNLARDIRKAFVNKSTKKVGVFVNATFDEIQCVKDVFQLNMLQLHGSESPEFCSQVKEELNVPIIKSFAVDQDFDMETVMAYEGHCDFFLFDAKGKLPGGNGYRFNWEMLQTYKGNTPFFLSGGISLQDIDDLKTFDHPQLYAVDVNSGFEWTPAIKKIEDVETFISELKVQSAATGDR